ncbi:LmeA family phospholipid-binding protein [Streptomyces bobili]|uniref:LmeA family phospholipid-binding protein n=1 Tax=Streptomyces bobili TaxID=67280 RepID=UPI00371D7548
MNTPSRPSVHIRGFPVLTQLAGGTLRHVDVTAHDIPARGFVRPPAGHEAHRGARRPEDLGRCQ